MVKAIEWESLRKLIKLGTPKLRLVDVREKSEFAEGAIPTAINVPLNTVPTYLRSESKGTKLIFYCLSGVRCKTAADLAIGLGFEDVEYYPGSWKEYSSLPVEKKLN